jgi:hypothetical protein
VSKYFPNSISSNSSEQEIRTAYRNDAKFWHSDKNASLNAMAGIKDAKGFYHKRSIAISQDYGVSREKTISIIKNCAKSVNNEFIDN